MSEYDLQTRQIQSWVPNRISVQRAGLHALIVRGLGGGVELSSGW